MNGGRRAGEEEQGQGQRALYEAQSTELVEEDLQLLGASVGDIGDGRGGSVHCSLLFTGVRNYGSAEQG